MMLVLLNCGYTTARFGLRTIEAVRSTPVSRIHRFDLNRTSAARIRGSITLRLSAQVSTADLWVLAERLGFVLQNDASGFEHVTVLGDFKCQVGVLFHQ